MLHLEKDVLLDIARCLDSNRDMGSLSETSKAFKGLTRQLVLPEPVELRGPDSSSPASPQDFSGQMLVLAKQMHRVRYLKISKVPHLPHDFLAGTTSLSSLSVSNCTLDVIPRLPPQLTSLQLNKISLGQPIASGAFEGAAALLELDISSISGLTEIPALPLNLIHLKLRDLRDLTSPQQLPKLPSRLEMLEVKQCPDEWSIPRQLPSSLVDLRWTAHTIDLGPSLAPFTNLVKLQLATSYSGAIRGLEDLSPLQPKLQYFDITGFRGNFPDSISTLTNLVNLSISLREAWWTIPPVLHHLRLLERLQLQPAPTLHSIADLVRLTKLDLQYTSPVVASAAISSLTALVDLSIAWWYDTHWLVDRVEQDAHAALAETNPIPPGMQQLTNLRRLHLDLAPLPRCWTLPPLPSSLTSLTAYDCLLPSAAVVPVLTRLTLGRETLTAACFTSLPQQLHTSLKCLCLTMGSSIRGAAFPAAVFRLSSLESLYLDGSRDVKYIFPPENQPKRAKRSSSSSKKSHHRKKTSSSSSSGSSRYLPQVTFIEVVSCKKFVAVAQTAELAARYLPNLRKLVLKGNCPAVDEGRLEQLKVLLPQLVVERCSLEF